MASSGRLGTVDGMTTTPSTTSLPSATTDSARRSLAAFTARVLLVLVLMAAGMALLMALSKPALPHWLVGLGPSGGLMNLTLMGVFMALPVLVWLVMAPYPPRLVLEMTAVLLAPTLLAVFLAGSQLAPTGSASLAQHVLMVGGVLIALAGRYRHYALAPTLPARPDDEPSHRHWAHWWPTATGVALAAFSLLTDDPSDFTGLLITLMIPTAGYAVIASTGRARWSWPVLGVLVVAYLAAETLAASGELALVVVALGGVVAGALVRRWGGPPREMRWQAVAALAFLASAGIAHVATPDLARVVLALFLLLHGAWDIHHWLRNVVVSRSLSEWCAALDITLGLGTLLLVALT